ncbi:ABC-type nitrate/sulfonate/bicarbonate transport system permease component [Streptomyces griseoviridis]|uniref:ABC-type nitrate/sulfonate/bicarbonate transport system permease component n=1 Tax=Streptomyces griseoviridis TaxID=45398 RepID=A0ABT9LPC8_STRGD|nr:ABC-type nitrate/sulfonate/bicarbonate transport system permease component [Streptomyces griseoviridis]GGS87058.1 hypothetical protein GCM10010240_20530 [Streptomyces griseoviridis]
MLSAHDLSETCSGPTGGRAGHEAGDGAFWSVLGDTLTGWAPGSATAVGAGVVTGVVLSVVPYLREATASTVGFLRPIPSAVLIPLAVLLYGTGRCRAARSSGSPSRGHRRTSRRCC